MLRPDLITRSFIKRPESLFLERCHCEQNQHMNCKTDEWQVFSRSFCVCVCVGGWVGVWVGGCVGYRLKTVYITSEIWCMNFDDMN